MLSVFNPYLADFAQYGKKQPIVALQLVEKPSYTWYGTCIELQAMSLMGTLILDTAVYAEG